MNKMIECASSEFSSSTIYDGIECNSPTSSDCSIRDIDSDDGLRLSAGLSKYEKIF